MTTLLRSRNPCPYKYLKLPVHIYPAFTLYIQMDSQPRNNFPVNPYVTMLLPHNVYPISFQSPQQMLKLVYGILSIILILLFIPTGTCL